MSTIAMSLPNFNRLIPSHAASDSSSLPTSAIVHIPRYVEPSSEPGAVNSSPVDLRDEVAQRFGRYYQRFVGYPADDFQLPANTSVRYSLLQHAGTHPWETPAFKAGIAGFGGVVTTLSVGFLLSDTIQTPLVTAPLDYTLVSQAVDDGQDAAVAEILSADVFTVGDRPSTLNLLEFSSPPETARDAHGDAPTINNRAEWAASQPDLASQEQRQNLSVPDASASESLAESSDLPQLAEPSNPEQPLYELSLGERNSAEQVSDTSTFQTRPLSVADQIRDYHQSPIQAFEPDQQQVSQLGQNFPLTDHQLSQRLSAS